VRLFPVPLAETAELFKECIVWKYELNAESKRSLTFQNNPWFTTLITSPYIGWSKPSMASVCSTSLLLCEARFWLSGG